MSRTHCRSNDCAAGETYSSPSCIFIICEFGKHLKAVQRLRFASSWCVPVLHVFSSTHCCEFQMFRLPWITPARLKTSFKILKKGWQMYPMWTIMKNWQKNMAYFFSRFQTLLLRYHCNDPKSLKVLANIICQCKQIPWEKGLLLIILPLCGITCFKLFISGSWLTMTKATFQRMQWQIVNHLIYLLITWKDRWKGMRSCVWLVRANLPWWESVWYSC